MSRTPTFDELTEFTIRSNHIEWEYMRDASDTIRYTKALQDFLSKPLTEESVLSYHKAIAWDVERAGKYRTIQVYVWEHIPPAPEVVPIHMWQFFEFIGNRTSRNAHNEFESIHPFNDFNGRTGRAIRLHKALQEWYKFEISFLHKYYYQTLDAMS